MTSFKLVSLKDFIPRTFEIFKPGPSGEKYTRKTFSKDLIAGLTVGVVALPLAMAFSIAAGGTPAQGLYTAIIAGFFISFLGGSKFQIGGPTGAFVVIIFGVIARHGMSGLVVATVLAGLMLVALGASGLGRLIKFIPYPVTTGFTTGIGVIIFVQQIKDFLGLSIPKVSPDFFGKVGQYAQTIGTFQPMVFAVGFGTLAVILLVRKLVPRLPASVVGVVAATLVCFLLKLPVDTIGSRFGGIPASLPLPVIPDLSWAMIQDVFPDAITIALLAAIESLLSAVVADGMTGDRHNANMELVAQGLGNIASGIFGGIPATGAIARTATNIKSGAATPVAGIIHALTLVLFILFLAPVASAIPLASLSAVLMVVAWDMSDLSRFLRIPKRAPKSDTIVLLTTFALTVVMDLTVAVEVGVILAVLLFLRRMIETAEIRPGSEWEFANIDGNNVSSEVPAHRKNVEVYEITGPFFFGVADILQDTLSQLERKPKVFVLRMGAVPNIDSTGINALNIFAEKCVRSHMHLILSEVQDQPMKALEKSGLIEKLGKEGVAPDIESAIWMAEQQG